MRRPTDAQRFGWAAWNPSYRMAVPRVVPPTPPAMTCEEQALLDAVLAEPDADEPRARFAAWCDGVGDDRGTFIREQLAGRSGGPPPDVRWLAAFGARDVVFRRGFVDAVSLSGRAFLAWGEVLLRAAPVREVRLVAVAPFVAELSACPTVARLRRLDLRGNGVAAEALHAAGWWGGVEVLV